MHNDDQITIKWRAGIGDSISNEFATTMNTNLMNTSNHTKCCNWFQKYHKRKIKGGHVITLNMAEKLRAKYPSVVPGWQFCRSCYQVAKSPEESTRLEVQCPDSDYEVSEIELEGQR